MLKKLIKRNWQSAVSKNPANLWLIVAVIMSVSLGCSYFGKSNAETPEAVKLMTLADVKNSRDLISVMKTQDTVKDYVLTKVISEEKSFTPDGQIAQLSSEYWSGLNTVNMDVMKFSSSGKATQYLDDQETTQKTKGKTPARGKKANGDPTLFYRDSNDIITFITCRKDFCYSFAQEAGSDPLTRLLATTDFFEDYDKKYLSASN